MKKLLLFLALASTAFSAEYIKLLYHNRVEVYIVMEQGDTAIRLYSLDNDTSMWFSKEFIYSHRIK